MVKTKKNVTDIMFLCSY